MKKEIRVTASIKCALDFMRRHLPNGAFAHEWDTIKWWDLGPENEERPEVKRRRVEFFVEGTEFEVASFWLEGVKNRKGRTEWIVESAAYRDSQYYTRSAAVRGDLIKR